MGAYEAIGMLKKMVEQIKESQGFHAPSEMNDFQKLLVVVDAAVFMIGELNAKINKLEKEACDTGSRTTYIIQPGLYHRGARLSDDQEGR